MRNYQIQAIQPPSRGNFFIYCAQKFLYIPLLNARYRALNNLTPAKGLYRYFPLQGYKVTKMIKIKKLYKNPKELKEKILSGKPTSRTTYTYKHKFKKNNLVRIQDSLGPQNFTFLRRERGYYIFSLRSKEYSFDDRDFESKYKILLLIK